MVAPRLAAQISILIAVTLLATGCNEAGRAAHQLDELTKSDKAGQLLSKVGEHKGTLMEMLLPMPLNLLVPYLTGRRGEQQQAQAENTDPTVQESELDRLARDINETKDSVVDSAKEKGEAVNEFVSDIPGALRKADGYAMARGRQMLGFMKGSFTSFTRRNNGLVKRNRNIFSMPKAKGRKRH